MKNILGIVGSTRKMGNSELTVKMISRRISEPHSLSIIRLSDLNIKPCLGCYKCIAGKGECVLKDDMEVFLDALARADGVILSVPVYFFGPNGTIKMIVDRCCMFYPRFDKFLGKPCVIAILLGIKGKDGYTSAALGSAAMTMGLDIMGEANFFAAGLGEVLTYEKNYKLAEELGQALFSPKRNITQDGQRCQICGSQSFKFIKDGVECLVCQNKGQLISENKQICIKIKEEGSGSEVMTMKDRLDHLTWVRGKKDDYAQKRAKLKKMSREFSEDGTWIKGEKA